MPDESPLRFYFALPRLLARLSGRTVRRSEQNWLEANIAGALVHGVTFLFFARLLLGGRAMWQQLLLLVPLALLVCAWWSALTYGNALLIKAIRAAGFLRDSADRHLQSVCVGFVTTLFAWHLLGAGSWMRVVGLVWLAAVALNLAAAALLTLMHAEPA